MARAHAASACVQSDSIKGLAQSIAKPAYHRLLTAEPALRRAVPTLIIAFLITICLGAFVQVVDQNRQKRASVKRDLAALADLLAERLDRIASTRENNGATFERLFQRGVGADARHLPGHDVPQADVAGAPALGMEDGEGVDPFEVLFRDVDIAVHLLHGGVQVVFAEAQFHRRLLVAGAVSLACRRAP